MIRFITTFITVLLALFFIEMLSVVQLVVIQPFTSWLAALCASIILIFDDSVIAHGRVLAHSATNFAVSIEAGCNGVEAAIVLIAGVLALPASWTKKAYVIMIGFIAVQAMNVVRIISLFYVGQWNLDIFSWTHLYLWPVLIMLDVLLVLTIYLNHLAKAEIKRAL